MKHCSDKAVKNAIFQVAEMMIAAIITAPKGCGLDNVEAVILDGEEKACLTFAMRQIAAETQTDFINRDAENIDKSTAIVIIGVKNSPIGLPNCSLCGFENCEENKRNGARCAFNVTDLGIALGSAVSVAANHRIDNRIMFSAGKAAIKIKCLSEDVLLAYGIPLSVNGKNILFDRPAIAAAIKNE